MYSVLVVDDNPIHCQAISERFAACPLADQLEVENCFSLPELRGRISASRCPDILVMDILFADTLQTGIDAVKDLVPRSAPTQVIFITSHVEFCSPVYETRHVWFLTKPVAQEAFDMAVEKAVSNLGRLSLRPLVLRYNGQTDVVPIHLIRYIENDKRSIVVHAGDRVIESAMPLKEFGDSLPKRFVESRKGHLVNLDWVVRVTSTEVELKGGEKVPLSIRRRAAFNRALEEYLMEF